MMIMRFLALSLCALVCASIPIASSDDDSVFTNDFAVEIDGDDDVADLVAGTHGFKLVSRVFSHKGGIYHFKHPELTRRAKRSAEDLVKKLNSDPNVKYVEQQKLLVREKREIIHDKQLDFPIRVYKDKSVYQRYESSGNIAEKDKIPGEAMGGMHFKDPFFKDQWYLKNTGQTLGTRGQDVNVVPAWKKGFTGKNITACILDDGLDHHHPDLIRNYDPLASTDFDDNNSDPEPNLKDSSNSHGTRCAGEIAAQADNDQCGVGIAYDAKIGGVRILDGRVTDIMEAKALMFKKDYIDVYSASWGPRDNGATMEGPSKYTKHALEEGARTGRKGKGSIFMWATGNGGYNDDDCDADGYVSSIYSLSVGSINDKGKSTYFMESCASTMAVIHTGGASLDPKTQQPEPEKDGPKIKVVTTNLSGGCTLGFQGTSAAAPLAAGCMALVLQANNELTWRDAQHIVAGTAKIPNAEEPGWTVNGAGYHVNNRFGFGALDCSKMVEAAQNWKLVAPQRSCIVPNAVDEAREIPSGGSVSLDLSTDGCAGSEENRIRKLEHVQMNITLKATCRGDISLRLTSPSGTTSEMLSTRKNDNNKDIDFTFMTVRNWGEDPSGKWTLEVRDNNPERKNTGSISRFSMLLWGTDSKGKTRRRRAYLPTKEEIQQLIAVEGARSSNAYIRGVDEKVSTKSIDPARFMNTVEEKEEKTGNVKADFRTKHQENTHAKQLQESGGKNVLKDIEKQVEKMLSEREVEPLEVYKKNTIAGESEVGKNTFSEANVKVSEKSLEKEFNEKDTNEETNGDENLDDLIKRVRNILEKYDDKEDEELQKPKERSQSRLKSRGFNTDKKSDIEERVAEFLDNLDNV